MANGTLDLRTGRRREHRREDLITHCIGIPFNPTAQCPTFLAFLDRIMGGSAALIGYLQRVIGYSLTGDVSAQALVFFYGRGANGKSTLLRIVQELLGSYAITAAPTLLLRTRGEQHPTGMADLFAKRLAICQEVPAGMAFDEVTIKQLTGGDSIRARRMHQDYWEFEPTHKLIVRYPREVCKRVKAA